MNSHDKMISHARAQMMLRFPFFGTLLCRLKITPSSEVEKFAIDGITVTYNPEYVESLKMAQLLTLLGECTLHAALKHTSRREMRDADKFAVACRYEVDRMMRDMGDCQSVFSWDWPASARPLVNRDFANLVAEQIYARLPDQPPNPQGGGGGGNGNSSQSPVKIEDTPAANPTELAEHNAKWDMAIAQSVATAMASGQGSVPREIQLIADAATPKLPWTHVLRPYISQFAKDDYSFQKPNMGVFAESDGEIILPSLYSEAIGPVVVAVDTSGSIAGIQSILNEFFSEIRDIHRNCSPSELHYIDCDAKVHSHTMFLPGEPLDFSVAGGGGTDFRPVFEFVAENKIEPDCLIYFTDMYGSFPTQAPSYPVLWISYSGETQAPFGDVISAG